jgi:cysteine desulfurase/selenocysteine lyase
MAPQWDELRKDFPALERYVYLNAAAGSPTPTPVREAVAKYLREMETSGDMLWDAWFARREVVRVRAAELIGAEADEIAFVANASTGMNLIADLLAREGPVLTDEIEFPTVTLPWIHRGASVHFLPVVEGVLRLESFAAANAPKAATVLISHVQFSNGCRQDLPAFGAIKEGRRLVVCGSQSTGAFPIDVKRSGIDAFATSGHKWLCAGYGAGFTYMSRELIAKHPPGSIGWLSVENAFAFDNRNYTLLDSNRRTELGCPAFAGIFALGAALDYIGRIGIDAIAERVLDLNMYLTQRLQREGFVVLSPGGAHRSGETLVEVSDPRGAARFLHERAIVVTQKAEGVRISSHFYNNETDIETCVAALVEHRKGT